MTEHKKNVVASVLARLRNVADQGGHSFNDVLQAYVIERFLARLAQSPEADTVLLKGALMLRVWGVPRAADDGHQCPAPRCRRPLRSALPP